MSDPAGTYPSIFGGIKWLEMFPYSPPNLLSAIFLMSAVLTVFLGLEEVSVILASAISTRLTHHTDT